MATASVPAVTGRGRRQAGYGGTGPAVRGWPGGHRARPASGLPGGRPWPRSPATVEARPPPFSGPADPVPGRHRPSSPLPPRNRSLAVDLPGIPGATGGGRPVASGAALPGLEWRCGTRPGGRGPGGRWRWSHRPVSAGAGRQGAAPPGGEGTARRPGSPARPGWASRISWKRCRAGGSSSRRRRRTTSSQRATGPRPGTRAAAWPCAGAGEDRLPVRARERGMEDVWPILMRLPVID